MALGSGTLVLPVLLMYLDPFSYVVTRKQRMLFLFATITTITLITNHNGTPILQLFQIIKQYWLIICAIILLLITTLSLTPIPHLPAVPGSDKTHHFIAYGALFFPVALAKPKHWLLIGLLFMGWSGAIELIQPYVNRYGEWLDLLANSIGLLCGYILALMINKLIK